MVGGLVFVPVALVFLTPWMARARELLVPSEAPFIFLFAWAGVGLVFQFLGWRAHEPGYWEWKRSRKLPPRPNMT